MNNNKLNILITVILIINIIILIVVLNINDDKLNDMQNSFNNQLSNINNTLYNQINSLEQTIQQMKEEELNILSEYTITPARPNSETLMSDVTLKIKPKAFDESTTAVFYLGGRSVDMKRNGNEFTGTVSVPISNNYNNASVSLTQNGVTQTQTFIDSISFYEFFAKMDAYFEGMNSYSNNTLELDGNINYSFNSPFNEDIKSAHIYGIVNKNDRVFLESLDKNNLSNQIFNIKKSFTMDKGDKLEIYIKIITSSNITYLCYVNSIVIETGGQRVQQDTYPQTTIYDKSGNEILLY